MAIAVPDIGPRTIAYGDATEALGGGMLVIPNARNFDYQESPRTKTGSTSTGNENHEGKFFLGVTGTITFDVARDVASDVREYVEYINADGDFLPLGSSLPKQQLAVIHPDDYAGGAAGASAKTRWFTSVRLSGIGSQSNNADQDGMDDSNFVQLTFEVGYIATDGNGNPVPEEAQPHFRGDRLATHGMPWSLPAPYGPAI